MSKWLERIDEVYLINLAKRTDRLLQAAEELEKFNIPYKRISAIEKENGAEGLRDTMLLIFNEALEQGHENVLVFEDDVEFLDEPLNFIMDKVMEQMPDGYRMIMLGGQFSNGFTHFHSPNLLPVTKAFSTHAVMYSRLAMREIVDLGMGYPIDNWLVAEVQTRGGTYATYPMLASQRAGFSNIGNAFISWKPFLDGRYMQKIHELNSRI